MKNSVSQTRRNFFKAGLGTMGMLTAVSSLAKICGISTGGQPLGPFFPKPGTPVDVIKEEDHPSIPLHLANDNDLTYIKGRDGYAKGQAVYIQGRVIDAIACKPIPNATIVIWQASHSGRYNHKGDAENHDFIHPKTGENMVRSMDPSFQYWGRTLTDEGGEYQFRTIVPGFYPADLQNGWFRPPHIHIMVSATGYPQLVTQMYFRGKDLENNDWIQELNQKDALLQSSSITNEQREKLIVEFSKFEGSNLLGKFDIELNR